MTKDEIIELTIVEMDTFWSWGMWGESGQENEYSRAVIAELQRRLPEADIKTCRDFGHLGTPCCRRCHTNNPAFRMHLIDLSNGTQAWVCCAVRQAIDLQAQARDSRGEQLFKGLFGIHDGQEN